MNEGPLTPQEQKASRRGEELVHAAIEQIAVPDHLDSALRQIIAAQTPQTKSKRTWFAFGGGFATACAVVLVVLFTTGEDSPTAQSVAALAAKPTITSTPAVASDNPKRLAVRMDGLDFPTWKKRGWKPTGAVTKTLDGRKTASVVYQTQKDDTVIYTIVSGKSLPTGIKAKLIASNEKTEIVSFQKDGRTFVVWERKGRTCIVSAKTTPVEKLVDAVHLEV